jgi:flagellar motor switch protein FliM
MTQLLPAADDESFVVSKISDRTRSPGSIPGGSDVESYDFRNPSTFTREHQRILETALRAFADQTASVITSKLRSSCSHELESLQQTTYSAFINSLPEETLLLAASLNPINATALIHLPLEFAMLAVDLPLGGSGEADQPSRGLTEIENVLVGDLGSSLAGGDQILVATLRLEIQDEVFNTLLALPLTPILPALDATLAARMAEQSGSKSRDFATDLEARIRTAPVTVSVRLRPIRGRLADFANISVGDVFRLGHSPDSPWEVTSHGVVFAHALPGGEGTQAAFRVI